MKKEKEKNKEKCASKLLILCFEFRLASVKFIAKCCHNILIPIIVVTLINSRLIQQ